MNSSEREIFRRALAVTEEQRGLPADFSAKVMQRIADKRESRRQLNERIMTVAAVIIAVLFTGALVLAVYYFRALDGAFAPLQSSMHRLAGDFDSHLMQMLLPIASVLFLYALLLLLIDTRRNRRQLRQQ